jgi:hypothetical protein
LRNSHDRRALAAINGRVQVSWGMDAADRPAFLDRIGSQDPKLRSNLEALLASDQNIGEFLSQPLAAAVIGFGDYSGSLAGGADAPTPGPNSSRAGVSDLIKSCERSAAEEWAPCFWLSVQTVYIKSESPSSSSSPTLARRICNGDFATRVRL